MKNEPLVSIIIVNLNGKKWLEKCIPSIFDSNYPQNKIEIIIVDNGSVDGSVDFVRNKFSRNYQIRIIELDKNYGFAKPNNMGIRYSNGKFILFLNNDTIVTKNFLRNLIKIMLSNPKIGACQSKILLMENRNILDATGSFLTQTGFLIHEGLRQKDKGQYNKIREIFSTKGACMLARREILDKVGFFDEDFFAYFEETDLCWRIWLAGYSIVFVPDSVIYHKMGATTTRMNISFIEYHSFKNRICSLIKNLNNINLIKILPVHIFLCCGVCVLYIFMLKPCNAIAIMRAILWNFMNIRHTLEKRNIVQKRIRKVSDNQLFSTNMKKTDIGYFLKLAMSYCSIK
jgi:hypothetical protein